MVQYSPARVYGAQGNGTLQELPVPPRLRAERTYDYKLFARDLAGNSGSERGTIRVK